jgi:hypothetical protein
VRETISGALPVGLCANLTIQYYYSIKVKNQK